MTWTPLNLPVQVADVKKVLVSAAQVCSAGNICVLDVEGPSFIQNKSTGVATDVEFRGGEFKFDIWLANVPGGKPISATDSPMPAASAPPVPVANQFEALTDQTTGFQRQEGEFP